MPRARSITHPSSAVALAEEEAPKGRNIPAQGNALGNRPPTNPSPEPERSGDRLHGHPGSPEGVTNGNQRAAQGWQHTKIGEVADINCRPKKDELDDEMLASFIPMACVEAESGRFDASERKKVGEVKKGYTPMRDGDVIFAKVTPCMENGKAAVMNGLCNGIGFGSTEFFALRPKDNLLPEFLFYFMIQQKFRREAERNMTGAVGLRRVPRSFIEEYPIPLPPLPEQRRIVARIEELFSRLDAGVAALRHAKAQLQRYRQSVLAAAVTGQLTQTWREQHPDTEPASELLEKILQEREEQWRGRGKYKGPNGPKLDHPVDVPEGWQVASIDQLCINFDGQRVPLKRADRDQRSGEFPYYGASGVIDDIDDYLFDGDYLLIAEDGANLLSRSTPIAFQARGKFWVNNHAHVVQTRGMMPLSYIELFFNGKDITRFVTGTAQPKLTQANLNQIPVPLPPLAEQHQIVAEVEARTTAIDHLEAELDRQITRSSRLRQSTLASAFAGNLIPNA